MKSTLLNMVLSLLGITFIASASVAGVHEITKEPIAEAQRAAVRESLTEVLPAFDNSEMESITIDDMQIDIYTATNGGKLVGYAVQSASKQGYSGLITMMVGIGPNGTLLNVSILSHDETPGLGSKMCDDDNKLIRSMRGRGPLEANGAQVIKDGGDVDALTGATISSRAYLNAISRAYTALEKYQDNLKK